MSFMAIAIPVGLREAMTTSGRDGWFDQLPQVIDGVQQRWALRLGYPFEPGGQSAWVAPAHGASGEDLVLKVAWRHAEAEHEADGLLHWQGTGAIRLHRVERHGQFVVMLIERCQPGTPLSALPEPEQDRVIASLLRRLWSVPAPTGTFRSLQDMCDEWADEAEQEHLDTKPAHQDSGLVRDGIALLRSLPSTTERRVLLCTDLHAGNVLAAQRDPWLAIDPKPYLGDPTFDILQHLLNCDERLQADPHQLARRMAELLELDQERLKLWLFARCAQESANSPHLINVARQLAAT